MFIKIIALCITLFVLLPDNVHSDVQRTEIINPGFYRKIFIIGKCKPGARLITENLIKAPTKSDKNDGTVVAQFKFSNIGYISITCVHLVVIADTDQISYRISSGGIGKDYMNFAVEGKNAKVMMSRAIVYGI